MALCITTPLLLLLIVLGLARIDVSTCQVMKAKVSCLDCNGKVDLSGMMVVVKCENVKELAKGTTKNDGSFEIQISKQPNGNCVAKLVGGPKQVYGPRKSLTSDLIIGFTPNTYTTSKPLSIYTSCPSRAIGHAKCDSLSSSKTIDLPLPPQWGFAPSSYYFPFFPIIGIP